MPYCGTSQVSAADETSNPTARTTISGCQAAHRGEIRGHFHVHSSSLPELAASHLQLECSAFVFRCLAPVCSIFTWHPTVFCSTAVRNSVTISLRIRITEEVGSVSRTPALRHRSKSDLLPFTAQHASSDHMFFVANDNENERDSAGFARRPRLWPASYSFPTRQSMTNIFSERTPIRRRSRGSRPSCNERQEFRPHLTPSPYSCSISSVQGASSLLSSVLKHSTWDQTALVPSAHTTSDYISSIVNQPSHSKMSSYGQPTGYNQG